MSLDATGAQIACPYPTARSGWYFSDAILAYFILVNLLEPSYVYLSRMDYRLKFVSIHEKFFLLMTVETK